MKPSKNLEATAYHEAGHVVMAVITKKRIKYVTIEPTEDAEGSCQTERRDRALSPMQWDSYPLRTVDAIEKEILGLLAGACAQQLFQGNQRNLGSSCDDSKVIWSAERLISDDDTLQAYINYMRLRTLAILRMPDTWQAVVALAKSLLKHKTLEGRVAAAIVTRARRAPITAESILPFDAAS